MSESKVNLLIKSEFSSSLDDTIINRLAEALFCNSYCHEEFWRNFKTFDFFPMSDLIKSIEDSTLSHPNIIRIIIAVYSKIVVNFCDIEKVIICCLNHEDSDYSYTGLWCSLKLSEFINFEGIITILLENYIDNNNIIFESLYEDLLIEIYFKDKKNINCNLTTSIEEIIFENITKRVFLLKRLLEKGIELNSDMLSIQNQIENMEIHEILSNYDILYCYIICSRPNLAIENNIIEILKSNSDTLILIKHLFRLSNGSILKCILKSSKIGLYLWNQYLDIISKGSDDLLKDFLSIGEFDINLIPQSVFVNLLNIRKFEVFKNSLFGEKEIIKITNYFRTNNYQYIFTNDEIILVSKYFYSIFSSEKICNVLIQEFPGEDVISIKSTYEHIIKLFREAISVNFYQSDLVEVYLYMIKCCIKSNRLDDTRKASFIHMEINSLVNLQKNILIQNIELNSMDILSIESIKLAKEAFLIFLRNNTKFLLEKESQYNIEELIEIVMTASDLYDDSLHECILFCSLCFCEEERVRNKIVAYLDYIRDCFEIVLSIDDYLTVLIFFKDNVDVTFLFERLMTYLFKKDISTEIIIEKIQILNKSNIVWDSFTFQTEYCLVCKENIEELIEDIAISAKPMDCYGD